MNANANRLTMVPVAKWSRGEVELVQNVQRLIELDGAFGLPEGDMFDYLRPYHGVPLGAAIAQSRADVAEAAERNEITNVFEAAREQWSADYEG